MKPKQNKLSEVGKRFRRAIESWLECGLWSDFPRSVGSSPPLVIELPELSEMVEPSTQKMIEIQIRLILQKATTLQIPEDSIRSLLSRNLSRTLEEIEVHQTKEIESSSETECIEGFPLRSKHHGLPVSSFHSSNVELSQDCSAERERNCDQRLDILRIRPFGQI